jgi:hypothetical protein
LPCPGPFLARDGLEGTLGHAADDGDEAVGQGELGLGQAGRAATLGHVARASPHGHDVFRQVQRLGHDKSGTNTYHIRRAADRQREDDGVARLVTD